MAKQRFRNTDIPYAQRMLMQKCQTIAEHRDDAAKVALQVACVALNDTEGLGYQRLSKFANGCRSCCTNTTQILKWERLTCISDWSSWASRSSMGGCLRSRIPRETSSPQRCSEMIPEMCSKCLCQFCAYNCELHPMYTTPREVDHCCFTCDECKHYDGDTQKRS